MKVFVVGTYLDETSILELNQVSRKDSQISVAAIKYSKLIDSGFKANLKEESESLFLAPIGMYPSCKVLCWTSDGKYGEKYIKFINVIFIKQLCISLYVFFEIIRWSIKHRNQDKCVVFTFIYLPFQIVVPLLRRITKIKFVSFVPDMPTFSDTYTKSGSIFKQTLMPVYIKITNYLMGSIDYFVYITRYMQNKFPPKPNSVIEGFVDNSGDQANNSMNKVNAIMYAGALYEKFGIRTLIKAFCGTDLDYDLWLFGAGDMVDEIKEYCKIDSRIKYFGIVPNSEVIQKQRQVKLLVNPRYSHEEFTKYSFPSKLIEYLSSGTPVLTTKLPGIPKEYDDIFYYFDREDEDSMRYSLNVVLSKGADELSIQGDKGKSYVNKYKTPGFQIARLLADLDRELF